LWSHYADKHRGVALGFDIAETAAKKVTYTKDRPRLIGLQPTPQDIVRLVAEELLLLKFNSWSYEREWRVRVKLSEAKKEGSLHFYPIGGDVRLKEVILGPDCSLPLLETRQLVDQYYGKEVVTYKAQWASGFFGVVPDEESAAIYAGME
jgi:hypothetical protein